MHHEGTGVPEPVSPSSGLITPCPAPGARGDSEERWLSAACSPAEELACTPSTGLHVGAQRGEQGVVWKATWAQDPGSILFHRWSVSVKAKPLPPGLLHLGEMPGVGEARRGNTYLTAGHARRLLQDVRLPVATRLTRPCCRKYGKVQNQNHRLVSQRQLASSLDVAPVSSVSLRCSHCCHLAS